MGQRAVVFERGRTIYRRNVLNDVHGYAIHFVNKVHERESQMPHLVDTNQMLGEGLIDKRLAVEIICRSRAAMTALAVNGVLCAGIIAATFGLIFWLANAAAVAVAGGLFLGIGIWVLLTSTEL